MRMVVAIATVLVTACSSSQPTFSVTGASVDPTYSCPTGSNNAAYDLHATFDARNDTGHAVTIDSITAEMKLTTVKGSWLEKVGDRYDAGKTKFEPSSVPAGQKKAIDVTIQSACTSSKSASPPTSSGDYEVTMRVATSAGTYSVAAQNHHRILAG